MKEIKIKSVIPIYLTGAAWLLYSFFFPLYKYYHLLIAAAVSFAIYMIASALLPKRTIFVKDEIPRTGDPSIDDLISKGEMYIEEFEKLSIQINNEKISGDISKIVATSKKMLDVISKTPDLSGRMKTNMDYYFPTVIKLLDSYVDLTAQESDANNILESIIKIEGIMDTVVNAFSKQLDNLYSDKAIDISADVEVLKNIISSEGLD